MKLEAAGRDTWSVDNARQKETPAEGRGIESSDQAWITWRRKHRGRSGYGLTTEPPRQPHHLQGGVRRLNQQRQQRVRAICLMPHLLLMKGVKDKKQGGINNPCRDVRKRARRRDNSPNPLWDLGSTLTRPFPSPRQSRRSTSIARSEN